MTTSRSSPWRVGAALLALVLAVLFGWRGLTAPSVSSPPTPTMAVPATATRSVEHEAPPVDVVQGRAWTLYLTRPDRPTARRLRGGADAYLAQALRAAQHNIRMAIYSLDLWSLRDALLAAFRRGVQVQMVVDGDHLTPEITALRAAGIPIVVENGPGLMHHKFVIIDDVEVWTGSMNFTLNGAYRNANHLVRLTSPRLAQDYRREFEEMFVAGRFGPHSLPDTPYPRLTLNGVRVEVFFSPDDHPQPHLADVLRAAQMQILLLAFTWTADPLTEVLLERLQAGVVVQGWLEAEQLEAAGSDYERLRAAGADLRPDPLPGLLHHKVLVLDGRVVVLGSYNFTRSAETRNDENLLVVYDADLAAAFWRWWQAIAAATR